MRKYNRRSLEELEELVSLENFWYKEEDVKEVVKECMDVIEGLYAFCPDGFSYAPADIFMKKWKNDG